MGEGLVLGVDDTTPELVLSRILFMASFIWWNKKAQNTSSLVLYNCNGPVIRLTQKIALGGFHPKRAKELVAFKDSQESEVWVPKWSKQCRQNYCEELPEEVYHAGVVLQNVLQQLSDFSIAAHGL